MSRTQRRQNFTEKISKDDEINLQYSAPYPIHDAASKGDATAIDVLVKRRDVNAYDQAGLTPLIIACDRGHTDVVRRLLSCGADVSLNDRELRRSALHFACLAGHSSIIDLLLAYGAGVFNCDMNGTYPMHMAAEGGYSEVIEQLMDAKALPDSPDADNAQPMHYAAKHNRVAAIESLYYYGAEIEPKDKTGARPMHYAAAGNSCNALHKLKQLGASVDIEDIDGNSPVHYACKADKTSAIHKLAVLEADVNKRNKKKECAIHVAAEMGLAKVCIQLVRCGVEVGIIHKKGRQSLHIAASGGHCETIAALHACGADLNCQDKVKDRPLHYAVRAEQEDAAQTLVKLGADVNAPGKKGNSPLQLAVKKCQTRMVYLLCSLRANCNSENDNCLFPIYCAALNQDSSIMKQLIRFGAQLNRLNSEGQTMIEVMVEEDKLSGVTIMKQFKADMNVLNQNGKSCVHLATEALNKTTLRHLMDLTADINGLDKHGLAAIHNAVINNSIDQINLLAELGANLDEKTRDFKRGPDDPKLCRDPWPSVDLEREDYWKYRTGMTAVHFALLHGHIDVLKHLIECGADINESNDVGETVFHCAALFSMTSWYEVLISLGADRNKQDKFGRSPVHYAAHSGDQTNVRYLLKNGAVAHAADNDGRQPLHYACQGGHFLLFSDLLGHSRAVDVNCRDKFGRTPLHFASAEGMIETMLELIQLKADVHSSDENGNTPLHLAAESGNHKAIVQLASFGTDINALNKDLKTPLHLAAEKGRGEAMEYLLMCGGNPGLRDKSEMIPTAFKVRGPLKDAVSKRISEFNAQKRSKYNTGEVDFQGKTVNSGKHVVFERLHISVVLESSSLVSPIVFFHRTPSDEKNMQVPLQGLEEVLSDVYELRVMRLETKSTLIVEVPMDGYPGNFEASLKTTENVDFKAITTSEQNGVPIFIGKIPVHEETVYRFAVVVRPPVDQHSVTEDGGMVMSETDRRIRVEIPKGTFSRDTDLHFQVLETEGLEGAEDRVLVADVVNMMTKEQVQPHKDCSVSLPLHDDSVNQDEIVVFSVHHERLLYDETRWQQVPSQWKVHNQIVHFNVHRFSIFIVVKAKVQTNHAVDALKRLAKERIRKALQRETAVVFFQAVSPRKNAFLTIFECTTPGKFKRRSEFWKKEGFLLHPLVKHSGHFVARPNQQYQMSVSGNLRQVGVDGRRFTLTFNPRAYKYQSFYLTVLDKRESPLGQIDVYNVPDQDGQSSRKPKATGAEEDTFLTSLPVELPKQSGCFVS